MPRPLHRQGDSAAAMAPNANAIAQVLDHTQRPGISSPLRLSAAACERHVASVASASSPIEMSWRLIGSISRAFDPSLAARKRFSAKSAFEKRV